MCEVNADFSENCSHNANQGRAAVEKKLILRNLLLLLSAQHRQRRQAFRRNQEFNCNSADFEFGCRPLKGPQTPPTPLSSKRYLPRTSSKPLTEAELSLRRPTSHNSPLIRPAQRRFTYGGAKRYFRGYCDAGHSRYRAPVGRNYSCNSAAKLNQRCFESSEHPATSYASKIRSTKRVVDSQDSELSPSSAGTVCSRSDCKLKEEEEWPEHGCARTRPYTGKSEKGTHVVDGNGSSSSGEVRRLPLAKRRREREFVRDQTLDRARRDCGWSVARRQRTPPIRQGWEIGRRGRFVGDKDVCKQMRGRWGEGRCVGGTKFNLFY
ncbi:unnamed protein product [Mesocestoides corti]|nr:unnamed protein product [Mesocestoides corti]